MSDSTRTYQCRIPDTFQAPLSEYAFLMAQVQHELFADLCKGKELTNLWAPFRWNRYITIVTQSRLLVDS